VGNLFFAGAAEFEERLPDPTDAQNATVIIRLREVNELGSTFIRVLDRYADRLKTGNNRLILAGVSDDAYDQLQKTGVLDAIGPDNVFTERDEFGASMRGALLAAGAQGEFTTGNPLRKVEMNLQQSITMLSGAADISEGARKDRLTRNRDQLTPIAQEISTLNSEEMARAESVGSAVQRQDDGIDRE
jgi:anti-anti-sigma regulatory factor